MHRNAVSGLPSFHERQETWRKDKKRDQIRRSATTERERSRAECIQSRTRPPGRVGSVESGYDNTEATHLVTEERAGERTGGRDGRGPVVRHRQGGGALRQADGGRGRLRRGEARALVVARRADELRLHLETSRRARNDAPRQAELTGRLAVLAVALPVSVAHVQLTGAAQRR